MHYDSLLYLCEKYSVREIKEHYLRLLSYLTASPEISLDEFKQSIEEIYNKGYILIAYTLENQKIFIHGAATILYESKIIHGCKKVGHIEDVVVSPNYRGQGIATALLTKLKQEASRSCYKIILDCREDIVPLYESCGLVRNGVQMCYYF